jgi:hypothetical protein
MGTALLFRYPISTSTTRFCSTSQYRRRTLRSVWAIFSRRCADTTSTIWATPPLLPSKLLTTTIHSALASEPSSSTSWIGQRDQAHRDQAPRELRSRERKAGRRLRDCLDAERLWPGHPGCRQPHGLRRMQVCHSPKPPNAVIEDCACNCLSLPQQCVTFI